MKKFAVTLVLVLMLCVSVFASEEGVFVMRDLGDYKIVTTLRVPHAWPHGIGPSYLYYNYGVTDADGNFVVEPVYQAINEFKEQRSLFKKDGKYGYFDENWNVVIEPIYKMAQDFSEGLALTAVENRAHGFIDKDGNVVIPHTLDYAESFKDGLAVIGKVDEGDHYHTFIRTGKFDRECRQIEPIGYKWEESYEVQMSQNNININGSVYKNSDLEYPFINYLGYTYIPLSFYTCSHLGFATMWNPVDGLSFTPPGSMPMIGGENEYFANVMGKNDMIPGKMFKAQLYKGSITIAGETYTAEDVYYPLLTYRDVVYIPVLWRQGMEGLGLEYSYDLDTTSLVFKPKK